MNTLFRTLERWIIFYQKNSRISSLNNSSKMTYISGIILIICMYIFSGCRWVITSVTSPSPGSSFVEWCLQRSRLPTEARKIVDVLLEKADTSDCEQAANKLLSHTELYLGNYHIGDLRPLEGLINLTLLDLNNNQITDVSPLAKLTNLNWLYLNNNQITDISPLAGLINLQLINLAENQILDISSLSGLTNLN